MELCSVSWDWQREKIGGIHMYDKILVDGLYCDDDGRRLSTVTGFKLLMASSKVNATLKRKP